ncbi:MAG TPA: sigma factor-like helix-turn-helix DNA-binding protein, partial [Kribbellaceae bacterium]
EAWLRLSRTDAGEVENLGGWLTTVVARVCLNMLQSRKVRRDEPVGDHLPDMFVNEDSTVDPEQQAVLADSVGVAMLVVLDTLAPAERLAFVLHDMFAVPFEDIAEIVGRSPAAARQLASRARRRVQGGDVAPDAGVGRRQQVVDAFLAASRQGDFERLIELLDPDAVCRADAAAVLAGADAEVRGAAAVAQTFAGRARAAQVALIDGAPGLVWSQAGTPRVVFAFTITDDGRVTAIDLLGDPTRLTELDIELLDD